MNWNIYKNSLWTELFIMFCLTIITGNCFLLSNLSKEYVISGWIKILKRILIYKHEIKSFLYDSQKLNQFPRNQIKFEHFQWNLLISDKLNFFTQKSLIILKTFFLPELSYLQGGLKIEIYRSRCGFITF